MELIKAQSVNSLERVPKHGLKIEGAGAGRFSAGLVGTLFFWLVFASSSFAAKEGGIMTVYSDRLDMDEKKQVAVFSGNVRAADGQMKLAADRMTVYYFKGKGRGRSRRGGIRKVLAVGHVVIQQANNKGVAESAVYKLKQQTLELMGRKKNAVIEHGDNRLEGKHIVLTIGKNRRIEKVSVKGGSRRRVSARITPSGGGVDGSKTSPPVPAGIAGGSPSSQPPRRRPSKP